MILMFKKIFRMLVPQRPNLPEPSPDVITSMIKPEPGAILGGRRKTGQ
jgi:hypothetical protein